MRDTDAWFTLNVGRITCSDDGWYTYEAHYSRDARLTSLEEIGDLASVGEELHHLLDKAIDHISKVQGRERE